MKKMNIQTTKHSILPSLFGEGQGERLLIILFLLLFPAVLSAQTLTLAQARQLALETNKDVAKSNLTLEQLDYEVKAYKSNYYPRINLLLADFYSSAKGDVTISGGQLPIYVMNPTTGSYVPNVTVNSDGSYTLNQYALFPDQSIEYKVNNVFMGTLYLQQPLYMGGKISAGYRMAQLGQQMAQENTRLSNQQTLVAIDEAYAQAVKAKELAEVAKAYKQLLDELQRNVQSAVNHGMKTRNDLLKVQVKLNEAELSIQKADNAYRLARMNLNHLMGRPLDTQFDVADELPAESVNDAAASTRPETAILQHKADLAAEQVKLQQSEYLPHVALFAGLSYANGGEFGGERLMNDFSGAVGVMLKMPVFTFGESTNKIRAAKAKQKIALLEQEDLDEQMQLELSQAKNNLEEADTEVRLMQNSLQQTEENLRLTRKQYEVGFEPLSELLDAQALWQEASANLVNAKCQQFLAKTKYLKAAGQL